MSIGRLLLIALGTLCLVLAIVGVILPVLPTTPFLLVTAFCYSKASKRLHHWLESHRRLGPPLRHWREHGAIRPGAKIAATLLIVAGFTATILWLDSAAWVKITLALVGSLALLFVITRPSPPHATDPDRDNPVAG